MRPRPQHLWRRAIEEIADDDELSRQNPDPLLTVREAAEWFRSSDGHVRWLRRTDQITGIRVGKYVRYRASDLLRYIESKSNYDEFKRVR